MVRKWLNCITHIIAPSETAAKGQIKISRIAHKLTNEFNWSPSSIKFYFGLLFEKYVYTGSGFEMQIFPTLINFFIIMYKRNVENIKYLCTDKYSLAERTVLKVG